MTVTDIKNVLTRVTFSRNCTRIMQVELTVLLMLDRQSRHSSNVLCRQQQVSAEVNAFCGAHCSEKLPQIAAFRREIELACEKPTYPHSCMGKVKTCVSRKIRNPDCNFLNYVFTPYYLMSHPLIRLHLITLARL